jgi:hypothetical protein
MVGDKVRELIARWNEKYAGKKDVSINLET